MTASSSTLFDVIGYLDAPTSSGVYTDTRPAIPLPRGSGILFDLRGAPIGISPLTPVLGVLRKVSGRPHFERSNGITRLVTFAGIDTTAAGSPHLMLVTTGITIVITEVVILCTAAANVAVPASVGIGIAAGEDDIFPSQQLTGLLAANDVFRFAVGGAGVIAQSGEVVKLGIDAPATGASVSQTVQVELFGYRG